MSEDVYHFPLSLPLSVFVQVVNEVLKAKPLVACALSPSFLFLLGKFGEVSPEFTVCFILALLDAKLVSCFLYSN